MSMFGAWIGLETQIKGMPHLVHGLHGIFIASNAVLGEHVTIFHQVTIGSVAEGSRKGAPVIGNNVFIGPGAKVLGDIKVGDGAKIGANCVVVDDVPANALVVTPRPLVLLSRASRKADDTL